MIPRRSGRFVSRLTRSTMAMIMAGGRGSRLEDLTEIRAKPATPFGGKFRIIDFPLSNCVNSGIRQIFVLTQYKAHSLIQHIHHGWGYLRGEFGEFIQIIPAQQQMGEHWYLGRNTNNLRNSSLVTPGTLVMNLLLLKQKAWTGWIMAGKMADTPMMLARLCLNCSRLLCQF